MNRIALLALAIAPCSLAGTPAAPPLPEAPNTEPWIKPTLDLRARFEYGDYGAPGLDTAKAFTIRERVGLVTQDWHGFSALIEGEFLQAIVDDYDSAPSPYATQTTEPNPVRPTTQINDPETQELNQAYLQYQGFHTTIRAGRQRIILNNAAMVGNVGWRQNEQTYDALSISNSSIDDLTLYYAYANRANRIFGSESTGALRSFAGDIHLFNASYTGCGELTLTGYAFLMDFDETAANAGYISNKTYGLVATQPLGPVTLYGETAFQTDTSSSPAAKPDEAWYAHFNAAYQIDHHTLTLGCEWLDADFVTPLATVHAFNGYADAFTSQRLGLVRNPGLADLYLSHSTPLPFWGLNFSQALHLLGDNDSELNYGWEDHAVLSKKFSESFLAIAKFAYYDASGPTAGSIANPAAFDTTRFSLELNYKY